MSNNDAFEVVQNCFNLPTYQRRLRHLQSITVRNLACPESEKIDLLKFQVYFTLHKDEKSPAFYTSEKITGSLNPTWQTFDLQRCESDADLTAKFVIIRVWTGLSSNFKIRLECHVHLSGLVYFADKLQVAGLQHSTDTLLFGMYNLIFCHVDPASASPQLKQLVPDPFVPSGKVPAVVYMDQLLCLPSYSTSSLSRIHTVLRAIKQTHAAVQRIHSTIEDKLVSSSEHSRKLSQREELIIRVRQLRQELLRQTQKKQKDEDELQRYKIEIEARRDQIKIDDETLKSLESRTEEDRQMHIQSREMLVKENAQVLFRRKQIIHEMIHYIYRITSKEKSFFICNVRLPNAEDYAGTRNEEQAVAVALGMTCHLIIMVSKFMNLPLRYPMMHRGSRSVIIDHIHSKLAEKEREFPLFGKGKEKFQYNYAVFLLNKNISQLRFYCGLGTHDLRETLPNLKSLLEQRLGIRANSPSQKLGGASSIPSPVPTSFEGSLASRPSMAPSNSSSSLNPHVNLPPDLDARDSRSPFTRPGAGNSPGVEQFDMSPGNTPGSAGTAPDFRAGPSFPEAYNSLLKPNSQDGHSNSASQSSEKDFENSTEQERDGRDMNGSLKEKRKIAEEQDEEEQEDLFTSTEDNFFKVNKKKSATQILAETAGNPTLTQDLASIDEGNKVFIRDGALLWATGPHPPSFKLVKTPAVETQGQLVSPSSDTFNSSPPSSPSPSSPMAVPSSNGRRQNTNESSPQLSQSHQNNLEDSQNSPANTKTQELAE